MSDGYATVARDRQATVWGLLWSLELADVRPLDAYEDVARGLYVKTTQPVLRAAGGSVRAFVYIGSAGPARPASAALRAPAGYVESILSAARALNFPVGYLREIEALAPVGPGGTRMAASRAETAPPKVRPRYATPFDL
jgi:hypothetical protein